MAWFLELKFVLCFSLKRKFAGPLVLWMIVTVFLIKDEDGGGRRGSKVACKLNPLLFAKRTLDFCYWGFFVFFLSRRKPNSVRLWREGAKEIFFLNLLECGGCPLVGEAAKLPNWAHFHFQEPVGAAFFHLCCRKAGFSSSSACS